VAAPEQPSTGQPATQGVGNVPECRFHGRDRVGLVTDWPAWPGLVATAVLLGSLSLVCAVMKAVFAPADSTSL